MGTASPCPCNGLNPDCPYCCGSGVWEVGSTSWESFLTSPKAPVPHRLTRRAGSSNQDVEVGEQAECPKCRAVVPLYNLSNHYSGHLSDDLTLPGRTVSPGVTPAPPIAAATSPPSFASPVSWKRAAALLPKGLHTCRRCHGDFEDLEKHEKQCLFEPPITAGDSHRGPRRNRAGKRNRAPTMRLADGGASLQKRASVVCPRCGGRTSRPLHHAARCPKR